MDHLNLNSLFFVGKLQVFIFEFLKFRILDIFNFSPMILFRIWISEELKKSILAMSVKGDEWVDHNQHNAIA